MRLRGILASAETETVGTGDITVWCTTRDDGAIFDFIWYDLAARARADEKVTHPNESEGYEPHKDGRTKIRFARRAGEDYGPVCGRRFFYQIIRFSLTRTALWFGF